MPKLNRLQRAKAMIGLAAFASFALSVFLWFTVGKDYGLFVGLWVPSILSLGAFVLAGERPAGGGAR